MRPGDRSEGNAALAGVPGRQRLGFLAFGGRFA
jgi:hypothetical protein